MYPKGLGLFLLFLAGTARGITGLLVYRHYAGPER